MKIDGNPKDPVQRLRNAPRCTAMAKSTRLSCRNPSKQFWNVCRLHGAGALSGSQHPNYRHGMRSNLTKDIRRLAGLLQSGAKDLM